ncbi:hypothetical protein [Tissierella sp.]|uniref:hypothetical protein n=1 Tax=Tissierella sp. TaxID=41274 RepID=UPI0030D9D989
MDGFKKFIINISYGCIISLLVSFITPKIKMILEKIKSIFKKNPWNTNIKFSMSPYIQPSSNISILESYRNI